VINHRIFGKKSLIKPVTTPSPLNKKFEGGRSVPPNRVSISERIWPVPDGQRSKLNDRCTTAIFPNKKIPPRRWRHSGIFYI
jgi:hypothetical protein